MGRSIEARSARPDAGYTRVQRISSSVVAPRPPRVETSAHGATWIAWGSRPDSTTVFAVAKARKLTVQTGRFSRILDILRARTNNHEMIGTFELARLPGGAMLATVQRLRSSSNSSFSRAFWHLRTYGE